jgi:hypothetical protein
MGAECALVDIALGMYIPGIIGARRYAGLASDALFGVDEHNSILGCPTGACRAYPHTRRFRTVIAALGTDIHKKMGILAGQLLFYPVPVMVEGHLVLVFAGNDTSAASNAFFHIHSHSVSFFVHH